MPRGEEIAAELRADQQATNERVVMARNAKDAIAAQADELWRIAAEYIQEQIAAIGEGLPMAAEAGLRSTRIGKHTLIVSTKQLPLLNITLNYRPKTSVDGTISEQFTAFSHPKAEYINPIRFTVDRNLQAYFTDGEAFLTPHQFGDEILERARLFFKKALQQPSILS